MTLDERIKKHRKTIEDIEEDIEWLKKSQFAINSGTKPNGYDNEYLIKRQNENIIMYKGFITELQNEGA
ncbi:MAG: hypothetical protein EWV88_06735 [Microcystis wesenbergii Mw_MB_S_20031200_S109D]|uniref:Uncharacterized protein n=1 Tax=Microcystis wesenbergii Mw_MB_S_20031200_S109D TaxID=2486241 RepID=A0A552M130_9CHRO|nr:MAG: hypothetical protein EWV88_06735 [Microcystis wesenbergii Mw_MB_S_20031200_S109D]